LYQSFERKEKKMENEKLELFDLMIEVTRKCNMFCEHCLRGKAQNKIQSKENIDKIFSKVNHISCITFTGGEPSLHPEIIEYCLESAKKHNVSVNDMYIVTNGKKVTVEFLVSLVKWYAYCDCNEVTGISLSKDNYHETIEDENINLLKALSFFQKRERKNIPDEYLIKEGNAKSFGQRKKSKDEYSFDEETNRIEEGLIYLNCKGNLIAGCDFSYRTQDKKENIICHVNKFNKETLINFMEENQK
jgi:organic radical activating enzyme